MLLLFTCADGAWGPDPPEKSQSYMCIGFLGDIVQDPLKNHNATKPAFNVGPPSARQRAENGPLLVVFTSSLPSSTKKMPELDTL